MAGILTVAGAVALAKNIAKQEGTAVEITIEKDKVTLKRVDPIRIIDLEFTKNRFAKK